MNKKGKIVIHIEEPVMKIIESLADLEGVSMSKYGRKMIFNNLNSRGLLPPEILQQIVVDDKFNV